MFFFLWAIISSGNVYFFGEDSAIQKVPYSVFKTQVDKGEVAEIEERSWLTTLFISLLPWVLIIGFFVYMNRRVRDQIGGTSGGAFGFGKSKAKKLPEKRSMYPLTTSPDWRTPKMS